MKPHSQPRILAHILVLALLTAGTILTSLAAQAQTFKVLYSFTGGADGGNPYASAVFDAAGNLYSTTFGGGDAGCFSSTCGVVFQLTPGSDEWSESTLYTFTGGSDGGNPEDSLIFDAAGNLYGTAVVGGVSCGHTYGCGVAFELSPGSSGWTETVLHSFQGGMDGYYPIAGLTFDKRGHLFSTTYNGGSNGQGSVYKLTKGTNGWSERTLFSFTGPANPEAAVTFDAAGNLYGTTPSSESGIGTVFELQHGSWKERTLYAFNQGGAPKAGLVFDKDGNLYGTTESGGRYGKGIVFRLAPGAKGKWRETVLHNFRGAGDGEQPLSTPVFDKAGNLYGTTYWGGDSSCNPPFGCGTVFKLTPGSRGRWKETVLHRFAGSDGRGPESGLTVDAAGNLFGTTFFGGNSGCYNNGGCGVVYEITP